MGGGGFMMDPRSPLDEFLLSLSPAAHPRVCFVPTPTGDRDPVIAAFFEAFSGRDCKPSCSAVLERRSDQPSNSPTRT